MRGLKVSRDIGATIKTIMKNHVPRITQAQLSEKIGVAESTLTLKLLGKRAFEQSEIEKISQVLNLHPAALIFDFGDPHEATEILRSVEKNPSMHLTLSKFPDEIGQMASIINKADDPQIILSGLLFALSVYKAKKGE